MNAHPDTLAWPTHGPWSSPWHAPGNPALDVPHGLRSWLQEPGSLTHRLRRRWPDLAVQVVHQGLVPALPHEAARLGLATPAPIWARCVELMGGGQVRLRARSAIPRWGPHNAWRSVQALGTRPLGELLFGWPDVQRSPHEWACWDPVNRPDWWSRRCLYQRHNDRLLLTETFVGLADTD